MTIPNVDLTNPNFDLTRPNVDGGGDYRLFRNGAAVAITDRRGRAMSDASSGVWDATTVIDDGDGFDVLLEGSGRYAERYLVWDVGSDGVIANGNGWFNANQMLSNGYEISFDHDFNNDGHIGEPPLTDADGDGFVDGGGNYQLFNNGAALMIRDRRGRAYSDSSNNSWDAAKSITDGDGFDVLLEGTGRYDGRYLVWDVASDGVIQQTNGWFTGEQMMEEGYETSFERDFNDDDYLGAPPVFDEDGDGFVDGGGDYRLFRDGVAVQLRHRRGRTYSDSSSRLWNATSVIDDGDGFAVLVEGSGRLADQFVVWDVGSDGVITNSNGWYTGDRMLLEGYETSFDRDFNDDGIIGIPPVEDSDGDGLVDGAGAYRLFRDAEAVDLQNRRGRTYSDLSSKRWDVTKAVVTDDGFDVLLEGGGSLTGRYLVWEAGADGVITRSNGWASSDRLTQMGFGDLFA